ncbi:uncharacterized protein N7446_006362 [Penicillium canescens]|uniref:uncharacterized protein n=1 Tax=Penicillium canescens TaxID=5083 RepID=UPI0026E0B02B|nr:uncharacterized protein N7446_006362 [Penicillium canescens]KAJ6062242.1 hypothetical protein N7446_006362 [Penicillium canescens]KAJ6065490.1 hypothetical protein N7444_001143 [Penicillium canescens]
MHVSMLDTWLSLNINDSGLTADMTVPPTEREEATEMTLCLIRCEIMRIHAPTRSTSRRAITPRSLAKDLQQRLEESYLKHCDTTPIISKSV